MKELQKLMDDIAEWSDTTFGRRQRNPAITYHLKKEIDELICAIEKYQNGSSDFYENLHEKVCFEFADCFMLLLDSASHFGFTADDLFYHTKEKLEINKNRSWGKPDENGVIEHKK